MMFLFLCSTVLIQTTPFLEGFALFASAEVTLQLLGFSRGLISRNCWDFANKASGWFAGAGRFPEVSQKGSTQRFPIKFAYKRVQIQVPHVKV